MIKQFISSLKHSNKFLLSNKPFYNIFDQKALQKKVANYELKTLDLHEGNQQLHDIIFDMTYKLEQETEYQEAERNLIIYLNIGDLNLTNGQKEVAKEGLEDLAVILKEYDNDIDLKSHLFPQTLYRLGAISIQEQNFDLGNRYYSQVAQLIEEDAQSMSEEKPISIDKVKLLSKAYEKLGNIWRQNQELERSVEFYFRSHEINCQAFPPNHPFSIKVQTYLGDTLRKLEKYEQSLSFLQTGFNQIQLDNQQNANLYVVASQGLAASYFNLDRIQDTLEIINKSEEVYEKHKELIPVLSFSNFHHFKAIVFKGMGEKDKAQESLAIAISLAEGVLPEDHQVLKTLKSFQI